MRLEATVKPQASVPTSTGGVTTSVQIVHAPNILMSLCGKAGGTFMYSLAGASPLSQQWKNLRPSAVPIWTPYPYEDRLLSFCPSL